MQRAAEPNRVCRRDDLSRRHSTPALPTSDDGTEQEAVADVCSSRLSEPERTSGGILRSKNISRCASASSASPCLLPASQLQHLCETGTAASPSFSSPRSSKSSKCVRVSWADTCGDAVPLAVPFAGVSLSCLCTAFIASCMGMLPVGAFSAKVDAERGFPCPSPLRKVARLQTGGQSRLHSRALSAASSAPQICALIARGCTLTIIRLLQHSMLHLLQAKRRRRRSLAMSMEVYSR